MKTALVVAVVLLLLSSVGAEIAADGPRQDFPSLSDARSEPVQERTRVTLVVGGNAVLGTSPPGTQIGVTWTSPDEATSHRFSGEAWETEGGDGEFGVHLQIGGGQVDGTYVFADPGTHLAVDIGGVGDPVEMTVPVMYAVPDWEHDRLTGVVPRGHTAWLDVKDRNEGATNTVVDRADLDVQSDGTFTADLSGLLDLERGEHYGNLWVERSDGHRFKWQWSLMTASVSSDGTLRVFGPPHRRFRITLADPLGNPYIDLSHRLDSDKRHRPQTNYTSMILQEPPTTTGAPPLPQPGDRVDVAFDEYEASMTLPELDVWAIPSESVLRGLAPPGEEVRVHLFSNAENYYAEADASGHFEIPVGAASLRGGTRLYASITQDPIRYGAGRWIAYSVLDLDTGILAGAWRVNESGRAVWSRDGNEISTVPFSTDDAGLIQPVELPLGAGEPFLPGDTLSLLPDPASPSTDGLSMEIPAFQAEVGGDPPTFHGFADPSDGGSLTIHQPTRIRPDDPTWLLGLTPRAEWTWHPDGRFEMPYEAAPMSGPDRDWQPQVFAFLQTRRGNTLIRRSSAPVLAAASNTRRLCGNADPHADVTLQRASADGSVLRTWQTNVGPDGRFDVHIDPSDPAVLAGDRWSGVAGGEAFDWVVPKLEYAMDWTDLVIDVMTDPGTTVWFDQPVRIDCWGREHEGGRAVGFTWPPLVADADGRIRHSMAHQREIASNPVGSGLSGAVIAEEGHNLYFRVYRLRSTLFLGTDTLEVRSGTGRVVEVTMGDGAEGLEHADELGLARVRLSRAGEPALIETGEVLTIRAGSERARLTVPRLDFDFSTTQGVFGASEPNAVVTTTYTSRTGADYRALTQADPQGRWRVPPVLEGRGGFSLLDVVEIRAEVAIPGGHRAVRVARIVPPEVLRALLPIGLVSRP